MATLKHRLKHMDGSGNYDVVYLETSSDLVIRPDGTNLEQAVTDLDRSVLGIMSSGTTPGRHASTHASGGSDVITPASIGAATASHGTHVTFPPTTESPKASADAGSPGTSSYVARSDHVHPNPVNISGNAATAGALKNSVTLYVNLSKVTNNGKVSTSFANGGTIDIGVSGILPQTYGGTGSNQPFGTSNPVVAGTASPGTATSFARSDHVHPAQTTITGNAATATTATQAKALTHSVSILVDLATENAGSSTFPEGMSQFKPGVTGILPITHGGTGQNTSPKAIYALIDGATSLNSSELSGSDYLAVQDVSAGTGKRITITNLKDALGVASGVGPHTHNIGTDVSGGVLDVSYGGTGASDAATARANLGAAASSHGTHVTFSSTAPVVAGTASAGSASTVARSDHVHPAQTSITGNAGSATKLATSRTLTIGSTGKSFNGTANVSWTLSEIGAAAEGHTHSGYAASSHKHSASDITSGTLSISRGGTGVTSITDLKNALGSCVPYATCADAADTATKSITVTGLTLSTGTAVCVKFTYANTATSPKLCVNGGTSYSIYSSNGMPVFASANTPSWAAGALVMFVFDGSKWIISSGGLGHIAGSLRLKNSSNYGCRLNFGDGDYVSIYEDSDDKLTITCKRLNIVHPTSDSTCEFKLNGKVATAKPHNIVIGTSTAGWTINDCDYLCDGSADNEEIQTAIRSLSSGGTVHLLSGTYNLSKGISWYGDNITLEGEGAGTILKRMFNGAGSDGWNAMIFTGGWCSGITIKDMTFDGNKSEYNNSYGWGIAIGIGMWYPCGRVRLSGLTIQNCADYGIDLGYYVSSPSLISGCMISGCDCGINIEDCLVTTVTGNYVGSCTTGIYIRHTGAGEDSNNNDNTSAAISGNVLSGNTTGILAKSAKLISISGNTIVGDFSSNKAGTGIKLIDTERSTIVGNTIARYTTAGVHLALTENTDNTTSADDKYNLIAYNNMYGMSSSIYIKNDGGTSNSIIGNKYS